jgi:hypothetical protein
MPLLDHAPVGVFSQLVLITPLLLCWVERGIRHGVSYLCHGCLALGQEVGTTRAAGGGGGGVAREQLRRREKHACCSVHARE